MKQYFWQVCIVAGVSVRANIIPGSMYVTVGESGIQVVPVQVSSHSVELNCFLSLIHTIILSVVLCYIQ